MFLAAFGLIADQTEHVHVEDVLKMEDAELLCCALSHRSMDAKAEKMGIHLTDPYYTGEEWGKLQLSQAVLVGAARELSEGSADQPVVDSQKWLEREKTLPLCECIVHTHDNMD